MRRTSIAAGMLGALAVALGAFGAHALRDRVSPAMLEIWRTAGAYHLLHSVVLLVIGSKSHSGRHDGLAAGLLGFGTVVFAGSLYLLVLTGAGWLGAVTPLGGVALIAGWLVLFFGAISSPKS